MNKLYFQTLVSVYRVSYVVIIGFVTKAMEVILSNHIKAISQYSILNTHY